MPNRCYNNIEITGPKEDIKKIRSYIKTKKHIWKDSEWKKRIDDYKTFLDNFYPMPDVLRDSYKIDTRQDYTKIKSYKWWWYEWRVQNRWCKWDVDPYICPTSTPKELHISFDSAWSPPLGAMSKLSKLHPDCDITHRYEEWGMAFSGEAHREDWELYYHEEYDDAYYGKGKECEECWWIYNGDNPDERHDDDRTICMYCWEDLEANKK